MLGAIIGSIVGSHLKDKNLGSGKSLSDLLTGGGLTTGSIMTLAIAKAVLECKDNTALLTKHAVKCMQTMGRKYTDCHFDSMFQEWIVSDNPKPYNSIGCDAAMRVSPCAFFARTQTEAKLLSKSVTKVTHDHPEGLKAAEATSIAIFLARDKAVKGKIKRRIDKDYYQLHIDIEDLIDDLIDDYQFSEESSMQLAILAFLESNSFESAIYNALNSGGNCEALAAITGSIAEAYYGVPYDLRKKVLTKLDTELFHIYREWEKFFKKSDSSNKFAFITKYIGKLNDKETFNIFISEFLNFVESHHEYGLYNFTEVLKKNNLEWKADSIQSADENALDDQCVLALITAAIRADHFAFGVLDEFIKGGYIDKWLKRLKEFDIERKLKNNSPALSQIKMTLQPRNNGAINDLFITRKRAMLNFAADDGGRITYQNDFGAMSEVGEDFLITMKECLEDEEWHEEPYGMTECNYSYELEAEYENGKIVAHRGAFDRIHIPEKAFKTFVETIRAAITKSGLGGIIGLDGFMAAIRTGEVKYCGVEFNEGGKIYHYRTTDLSIGVGDKVIVPVGSAGSEREVTVKSIDFCKWDNTLYPLEKTKEIIRKSEAWEAVEAELIQPQAQTNRYNPFLVMHKS